MLRPWGRERERGGGGGGGLGKKHCKSSLETKFTNTGQKKLKTVKLDPTNIGELHSTPQVKSPTQHITGEVTRKRSHALMSCERCTT